MKKTKNKLNLNALFRKRKQKLPSHTITVAGYYSGDLEIKKNRLNELPLVRTTIAVVKIPNDETVEMKEFWGDDDVDDFFEIYESILQKYPKAKVIHLDRPVRLEDCACSEEGCSGYLTNLVLTEDLKRMK